MERNKDISNRVSDSQIEQAKAFLEFSDNLFDEESIGYGGTGAIRYRYKLCNGQFSYGNSALHYVYLCIVNLRTDTVAMTLKPELIKRLAYLNTLSPKDKEDIIVAISILVKGDDPVHYCKVIFSVIDKYKELQSNRDLYAQKMIELRKRVNDIDGESQYSQGDLDVYLLCI